MATLESRRIFSVIGTSWKMIAPRDHCLVVSDEQRSVAIVLSRSKSCCSISKHYHFLRTCLMAQPLMAMEKQWIYQWQRGICNAETKWG
ncbi:hypothetical protein GLYMA_08G166500v4 [Glycine max]|uniref:Uncharacterized protein n=3 Tax=Glycine subgen. Soja TaxID=1462606 RepID=A0A0R0IRK6_SOYBN|nr:hypothetical protein GYH30_021469 [Glycine max]KRH43714.1 hypothetical protein GLYMA_08G166500v4 [Glycine max]RZB97247.1 hypothetical protein D0Y65_020762 [Glycine soja]RZB97248.1 hypothetical protein D0Y65_020762 [Glycine soja]RZB97249.1 hypothetical protein D0Y65_020762 [Glycine soja]